MRKILYTIGIVLYTASIFGQWHAELETGLAFNSDNVFRFSNGENSNADRLNVTEELEKPQVWFYRIRAGYTINNRHTLSALYAPLSFEYNGSFSQAYRIGDELFPANNPLTARYRFNSYRLTYRYEWINSGRWHFGLGVSGKIRDARIAVQNGTQISETTDLGFVPLINFKLQYFSNTPISVLLHGDALVGTQGRAEDVFLGILYRIDPGLDIKLGYRILEGGADVDQVYTFSLIQYLSVGIRASF